MATSAAQNAGTAQMEKHVINISGFFNGGCVPHFLTPYCQSIYQYIAMKIHILETFFDFAIVIVDLIVCESFIFN